MPTPNKNEKRKEFISRCIPIVLQDKTAKNQEQAVAICNQIFINKNKKKKE